MQTKELKRVKMIRLAVLFILAVTIFPAFAYADTASDLFGQIIGTATTVFMYLGSFMLVYALGSLFLAFRNEDAESKSRSGMFLLVSILLISVPSIYNAIVKNTTGEDKPLAAGNSLIGNTTE